MNAYEQRQEARRERLLERAGKAESRAAGASAAASRIADGIPFGQPILVGHHSEGRARRDAERIRRGFDRAHEERTRAAELRRRAESVGRAGVSSDDPEAVDKLRAKLQRLEHDREQMKRINAAWRKAGKPAPDATEGWQKIAAALGVAAGELQGVRTSMAAVPWHEAPFPAYSLSNLGGRIKATSERIAELEAGAAAAAEPAPEPRQIGDWTVTEDRGDNRLCLTSPTKPPAEVRQQLKRAGFRWSPTRGAWVRQLNAGARAAARYVLERLSQVSPTS